MNIVLQGREFFFKWNLDTIVLILLVKVLSIEILKYRLPRKGLGI